MGHVRLGKAKTCTYCPLNCSHHVSVVHEKAMRALCERKGPVQAFLTAYLYYFLIQISFCSFFHLLLLLFVLLSFSVRNVCGDLEVLYLLY